MRPHNERVIARLLVAALLWVAAWTAAGQVAGTDLPPAGASAAPAVCAESVPGGSELPAWTALLRRAAPLTESLWKSQLPRAELAGTHPLTARPLPPAALAHPPVRQPAFAHLRAIPLLI